MVTALIQAVTSEFLIAPGAVKLDNTGEELPKEVLPRDFLRTERQDKFVEFKGFISNVWRLELAMSVHKDLALLTELPSALARGEERGAVGASLQHILAILEKNLELLHEDLALQLILLVFQRV